MRESAGMRIPPEDPDSVRDAFHVLWYESEPWQRMTWFGVPIQKNPFDLFQYQEVLFEQQPDFVIECGAFRGGSTLYFAHLLDHIGHGMVVSVDIADGLVDQVRRHPRVITLVGDSISPKIVDSIRCLIPPSSTTMVVLDSDHRADHVLAELHAYKDFVQVGNYLIVEDTNINGHPVLRAFGPGPHEAVSTFLRQVEGFVIDSERECKLHFTFAPRGWLRRVS